MFEDMKARDNALWAGKQRISFTKRVCNCKCALRLHYVKANKEWRATVTCAYHTGHAQEVLPTAPPQLPTTMIDLLQGLRSTMGATVQQQLNFCAQSGLPVTDDFIRRLNASPSADATFGLSGDAGFLNTLLIGSVEDLSFAAEFELGDCP